jgi:hypothetical protein
VILVRADKKKDTISVWILDDLIRGILISMFHITDSTHGKFEMFFFRYESSLLYLFIHIFRGARLLNTGPYVKVVNRRWCYNILDLYYRYLIGVRIVHLALTMPAL